MSQVELIYKGNLTVIQCDINEKMYDIFTKFVTKIGININDIYFLYNGIKINTNLALNDLIKEIDRNNNKIKILVCEINSPSSMSFIKPKDIICPKCGECACINILDYKISLNGCKKGHNTNNILLDDFENTQRIDLSKIICEQCKDNNRAKTFNNEFFKCFNCKLNLCPLCKSLHNKTHNIINYEQINYICPIHNDSFISYCKTCNQNICLLCENKHENHNIINFKNIIKNKEDLNEQMKRLNLNIAKFKKEIKEIINRLNDVIIKIEKFYQITNNLVNKFEIKYRNYELLHNIYELTYNNNIVKDIDLIVNDNNKVDKIKYILNMYNKMNIIDEIDIIYGDW